MDYLVFQLQGVMSAWGESAVGEFRPTANYPSESALLGLFAAALGIRREAEEAHAALRAGYGFAIAVQESGRLLRDYHTVQVPGRSKLKGRPQTTRRDELGVPKQDLNTLLSTRDYRQNAACLVAVQANGCAPSTLEDLAEALREPRFVLYLGRKSCPPSAPLNPRILSEQNAYEALMRYGQEEAMRLGQEKPSPVERLVWGQGIEVGCGVDLETIRKDRLLSRVNWQFGDRTEYVKLIGES